MPRRIQARPGSSCALAPTVRRRSTAFRTHQSRRWITWHFERKGQCPAHAEPLGSHPGGPRRGREEPGRPGRSALTEKGCAEDSAAGVLADGRRRQRWPMAGRGEECFRNSTLRMQPRRQRAGIPARAPDGRVLPGQVQPVVIVIAIVRTRGGGWGCKTRVSRQSQQEGWRIKLSPQGQQGAEDRHARAAAGRPEEGHQREDSARHGVQASPDFARGKCVRRFRGTGTELF
jgi:hypothetical protein